ncbi:MAG: substrate-binding domain-containing protein [Acidobacteria bacterium]|nr:substrate-binding domain-containing protein [Acidobacteriota bacterium]
MTSKKYKKSIIILMFLAISMMNFAGEYAVIVNKANPVQELNAKALQKMFQGENTTWPDGNQVKIAALNSGDIHVAFVREVLKMTTIQFSIIWKQKIYSGLGTGTDIQFFKNENELKKYIESTPGAIGYLSMNLIDDAVSQVKIL